MGRIEGIADSLDRGRRPAAVAALLAAGADANRRTKGASNCGGRGFCFQKVPTGRHPTTAQLLLKLGATPLDQSGVEFLDVATESAKIRQAEQERPR